MKNTFRWPSVPRSFLWMLLIIALPQFGLRPVHAQQGQSSTGTDFWMAFMPNYLAPADNIRIFIASGTQNKVQVEVYGGVNPPAQHFAQSMQPNTIWTLSLPNP